MNYLVDKDTRKINLEAWFDEDAHRWIERGAVCWNPCVCCEEGEGERHGYIVVDIPEEEIGPFLIAGEEELYWINDLVLPRHKVQISFLAYISHPDFPDERKLWLTLSNKQIAEYQEFLVQEFHKFRTAYPDDVNNDELWHDWLDDAFAEAYFTTELPNALNPVPAHVDYLDFYTPKVESL